MSQNSDTQNRHPPRFVPTLTDMVPSAVPALSPAMGQPSPSNSDADLPAAFAELLKDWPALGEPVVASLPPHKADPAPDQVTEQTAEHIALRAEALVMQRLPAALSGLVSKAVRDALQEHEHAAKAETPKNY